MFRSIILSCSAFAIVSTASAQFNVEDLQKRFSTPTTNNGPNCYNTTLVVLGYMEEIVHVSPEEATFYVSSFCKELDVEARSAPNGTIIVYREENFVAHMAALTGQGAVFEKYNYFGSQSFSGLKLPEGFRGEYALRPLADSYVFQRAEPKDVRVLLCETADTFHSTVGKIQKSKWYQTENQIRRELAAAVQNIPSEKMGDFLNQRGARLATDSSVNLQENVRNAHERKYRFVRALSSYQQLVYLYENGSCRNCDRVDLSDFKNRMDQLKEALAADSQTY